MKSFKRIILVGKGASGKDHAREFLTNTMGFKYGVSYTTRPPRENEVNGKDYNFISDEDFMGMDLLDEWFEHVKFNGWIYGTTNEQFYGDCSLFIMTPTGLSHLSDHDRSDSFVIYFDIDATRRAQRMSERKGNADSIHRRLAADERDFKDFTNYNAKITNPFYTDENLCEVVRKGMAVQIVEEYASDSLPDDHIDSHHNLN
jgi:guanylate kinase